VAALASRSARHALREGAEVPACIDKTAGLSWNWADQAGKKY